MNKFFLYGLAAIFAISACKKTKKDEPATPTPQGQNEIPTGPDGKGGSIPATSDIYLFGKNGLPSSNYVLWTADAKFDNFLNYDLSPMAIEGLFIQGNKLNASKSVNFFGSHMISQNKYRISYFSKDKYYHLAEELKVPILPRLLLRMLTSKKIFTCSQNPLVLQRCNITIGLVKKENSRSMSLHPT